MSKGIAAMSYLDPTSVVISTGLGTCSMEAIKEVVYKFAELQQTGQVLDTVNVVCNGLTPYHTSTWEITTFRGASGTVTANTAIAGNTVTVNGLVYTAVAGVKSDNTEFSIDTGNTETAADLADSITNDTREGTIAIDITATSNLAVVTITADPTQGELGNSVTLASSGATLAVSGATLGNGVGFEASFQEELSQSLSADAQGNPAMSSRREIQFDIDGSDTGFTHTLRSLLTTLKFIEKLEDAVAKSGVGATGDGTYTDIPLYGATPYETFVWTIDKLDNVYVVDVTANS